jgi:hypothetical protein
MTPKRAETYETGFASECPHARCRRPMRCRHAGRGGACAGERAIAAAIPARLMRLMSQILARMEARDG